MNKTINKAIMNRSRFKYKFIKNPTYLNEYNYKRQKLRGKLNKKRKEEIFRKH